MQLLWLDTFLEVAKSGNFTTAADHLNITQSAVSKHIRALEDQWGVQLFDRRTFQLTSAGHIVYDHAKRINTECELLNNDISSMKEQEERIIRIAAIPALGASHCASMMDDFRKLHYNTIFHYHETGMEQALEELRLGTVDFAFVRINLIESEDHFQEIPIQRDPVFVLCDSRNHLSRLDMVSIKEVGECQLVCIAMAIPEISRLFRKFGQKLDYNRIVVSTSNSNMIYRALRHNAGIGIMTNHLAGLVDPHGDLIQIRLQENPCFILGMVCLDTGNRRNICREFKTFIRDRYTWSDR